MRMRQVCLSAVFVASAGNVLAAQIEAAASVPGCFEIVNPFRGDAGLILLNRCNGSSWMLTRDPLLGADQRPNNGATFSWHPLQTSKEPPVLLDFPRRVPQPPKPSVPSAPNTSPNP